MTRPAQTRNNRPEPLSELYQAVSNFYFHEEETPEQYPAGYAEARRRSSADFLAFFDGVLRTCAHTSVKPSNTILGGLYVAASFATVGVVPLALRGINYIYQFSRVEMYNQLIAITNDPRKLNLTQNPSCIKALQEQILHLSDLVSAPTQTLEYCFKPENFIRLQANKQAVDSQRRELKNQTDALKSQYKACTNSQQQARLQQRIRGLETQLEGTQSIMEQLRGTKYAQNTLDALLPPIPHWYPFVLVEFKQNIDKLESIITRIQKQETNPSVDARKTLGAAKQLLDDLRQTRTDTLNRLKQPMDEGQAKHASTAFIRTCQAALDKARPILEQDKMYGLRHVLADIANALILMGTCGMSYAIAGRFRLFAPEQPLRVRSQQILDEALTIRNDSILNMG